MPARRKTPDAGRHRAFCAWSSTSSECNHNISPARCRGLRPGLRGYGSLLTPELVGGLRHGLPLRTLCRSRRSFPARTGQAHAGPARAIAHPARLMPTPWRASGCPHPSGGYGSCRFPLFRSRQCQCAYLSSCRCPRVKDEGDGALALSPSGSGCHARQFKAV